MNDQNQYALGLTFLIYILYYIHVIYEKYSVFEEFLHVFVNIK